SGASSGAGAGSGSGRGGPGVGSSGLGFGGCGVVFTCRSKATSSANRTANRVPGRRIEFLNGASEGQSNRASIAVDLAVLSYKLRWQIYNSSARSARQMTDARGVSIMARGLRRPLRRRSNQGASVNPSSPSLDDFSHPLRASNAIAWIVGGLIMALGAFFAFAAF